MITTSNNNNNNTDLKDQEKWWQHEVETVLENETFKILWDFNIYTDRIIHHRRPDIVVVDKVDSRIKIIDIAVLWDANIESKYRKKVSRGHTALQVMTEAGNNYSNHCWITGMCKQQPQ